MAWARACSSITASSPPPLDRRRQGLARSRAERPFLSDARFLAPMGFEVSDDAGEWRLFVRCTPVGADAEAARFAEAVHRGAGASVSTTKATERMLAELSTG